jgi:NTP pyrophosphatase (non-canonical NTP hydrolase)
MPKYRVDVRRAYYHGTTREVEAKDEAEARRIAEDIRNNEVLELRDALDDQEDDICITPLDDRSDVRTPVLLRTEVEDFAQAMEITLRKHDGMKGKIGWKNKSICYLFGYLTKEVGELGVLVQKDFRDVQSEDLLECMSECTDIANLAMMIYDNLKRGIE